MSSRNVRQSQVVAVFVVILVASVTALYAQTYTVLYNFGKATCDPFEPQLSGIIAQGRDGDLYSTTAVGGCDGSNGAAFKITPKGKLTVVYSFNHAIGDQILAVGGLTLGTDGDFWGTNEGGELGPGNIFKLSAAGKETRFSVLGGTNDVNPVAPPVQGMDGN